VRDQIEMYINIRINVYCRARATQDRAHCAPKYNGQSLWIFLISLLLDKEIIYKRWALSRHTTHQTRDATSDQLKADCHIHAFTPTFVDMRWNSSSAGDLQFSSAATRRRHLLWRKRRTLNIGGHSESKWRCRGMHVTDLSYKMIAILYGERRF